jgi:hypothetical protein
VLEKEAEKNRQPEWNDVRKQHYESNQISVPRTTKTLHTSKQKFQG